MPRVPAARIIAAGVDALDGDLGAFAAVGCRIDGDLAVTVPEGVVSQNSPRLGTMLIP